MQQPSEESVKREILETIEHLDILQKQSLNRFDTPEIYQRVFQLLEILEAKMQDLNHLFPEPSPDTNRLLQDLFFNVKKMRESTEDLKSTPQKLQFQDDFIGVIDRIKEDLNKLGNQK